MADDGWTIDELAARVAGALGDGYPGVRNGRVRDVPDARAIRWYATIGLVDRPAGMRGRTALYGLRHLLQLVAVKRRQAQGLSIAEIQRELAGAGDAVLREIAAVPDALLDPTAGPAPESTTAAPAAESAKAPARSARFWAEPPAAAAPTATAAPAPTATPGPGPAPAPATPSAPAADAAGPGLLTGVPLGGGAVLLLPGAPDHDDLFAIAAAAGPLLDLLTARGLLRSAS
jgi:DNA-binding transcriptional MerR regulator